MGSLVVAILQRDRHITCTSSLDIGLGVTTTYGWAIDKYQRTVGLLWLLYYVEVLAKHLDAHAVAHLCLALLRLGPPVALWCKFALLDIDLGLLGKRKCLVVVLEHHNRLELHVEARLHKLGIAHNLLTAVRLEVWILEQSHAEEVAQQTHSR